MSITAQPSLSSPLQKMCRKITGDSSACCDSSDIYVGDSSTYYDSSDVCDSSVYCESVIVVTCDSSTYCDSSDVGEVVHTTVAYCDGSDVCDSNDICYSSEEGDSSDVDASSACIL